MPFGANKAITQICHQLLSLLKHLSCAVAMIPGRLSHKGTSWVGHSECCLDWWRTATSFLLSEAPLVSAHSDENVTAHATLRMMNLRRFHDHPRLCRCHHFRQIYSQNEGLVCEINDEISSAISLRSSLLVRKRGEKSFNELWLSLSWKMNAEGSVGNMF